MKKIKPPLTYYGGKQQLASTIIELIPKHQIYTEVFFGGGAIYFAKEPSPVEIINDRNNNVINFYKQLKQNHNQLLSEIESTLYSQEEHRFAKNLYTDKIKIEDMHFSPDQKIKLQKAWAVFVLAHQSFLSIIGGSWNVDLQKSSGKRFTNKKKMMVLNQYGERLENTAIFNDDALYVLKRSDRPEAFHYIDPPYIDTNLGHYKGYSLDDYRNLLEALGEIKGKFLLSSFPSDILAEYSQRFGWNTKTIEMNKSASAVSKDGAKTKVEVLTSNY